MQVVNLPPPQVSSVRHRPIDQNLPGNVATLHFYVAEKFQNIYPPLAIYVLLRGVFSVSFHSVSETCKLGGGGSNSEDVRVCGIVCKDGEGLQTVLGVVGERWGGVWQKTEGAPH
jgi:hypothetical protein